MAPVTNPSWWPWTWWCLCCFSTWISKGVVSQTRIPDNLNTTESLSPFLKSGTTYEGQLASRIIDSIESSVAVLITVDNWSKWSLIEPEFELECGQLVIKEFREDKGLPEVIEAGYTELMLFEKKPGITGVCGVVTYMLDLPPDEEPEYLQLMFSVPYNLNLYKSYFAVGITSTFLNATDLFKSLYYYSGSFERKKSGQLGQFSSERIKIRGTMDPDTYKPILRVSIIPVDPNDRFTAGDFFPVAEKRGNNEGTKVEVGVHLVVLVIHCIIHVLYV